MVNEILTNRLQVFIREYLISLKQLVPIIQIWHKTKGGSGEMDGHILRSDADNYNMPIAPVESPRTEKYVDAKKSKKK